MVLRRLHSPGGRSARSEAPLFAVTTAGIFRTRPQAGYTRRADEVTACVRVRSGAAWRYLAGARCHAAAAQACPRAFRWLQVGEGLAAAARLFGTVSNRSTGRRQRRRSGRYDDRLSRSDRIAALTCGHVNDKGLAISKCPAPGIRICRTLSPACVAAFT